MPTYGDIDHVKRMLRPAESAVYGDDAVARLEAIQASVSIRFTEAVGGMTFGDPASDTTVLVWESARNIVLLPRPARAITSVTTGGTVAGATMTGGTTIDADEYVYDPYDAANGLIWGLRLVNGGSWGFADAWGRPAGPVKVVGDFSDTDADETVPPEVTDAVNYLIAEEFKAEKATGGFTVGPDGMSVPLRDPWKANRVAAVIAKYRGQTAAIVV